MSDWTPEKLAPIFKTIQRRYPFLPVLAISWMYLNNARHAVYREMGKSHSLMIVFSLLARVPWILVRGGVLALQLIKIRIVLRNPFKELCSIPFAAVAKSWSFSTGNSNHDFYLGNLSSLLQERGVSLLTLCGDRIEQISVHSSFRLPELGLLQVRHIFWMLAKQLAASFYLLFQALLEKDRILRPILFLVSRDCLRTLTLRNGLYYWVGKQVFVYWKPKFFISLYEGNAWEKCLAMGLKEAGPACRLVGYQHTVILARAQEMRRPTNGLARLPLPDLILTTGPEARKIMQPGFKKYPTRFLEFGSFRFSSQKQEICEPKVPKKTILVLPEGIREEMILLFNTAIALAQKRKDYQILLRCHPAMPFETIRSSLSHDMEAFPNLSLSSKKRIEEDFASASVVLYRGSSAILYAILAGLKPIYFDRPGLENVDPLFSLNGWRDRVSSTEEIEKILDIYCSKNHGEAIGDWKEAVGYVQNYIQPVKATAIDQLLEQTQ